MYTDSHCHPENKRFDSDRPDVFARAKDAGVTTMLAIGNGDGPGTGTFDCAIKLAEQYDGVYATVGIHPHEAALATPADFDELVNSREHPKVVAWGEIGLDYFYDHSPRDVQQKVFLQQMELAKAAKLPIIIHCRPSDNSENAWDDTLRLIRENWAVDRTRRRDALLHRHGRTCARLARSRLCHFVRRQHHLSKGAEHSGRRQHGPAGSDVHRDRLALPRARSASRQAQ